MKIWHINHLLSSSARLQSLISLVLPNFISLWFQLSTVLPFAYNIILFVSAYFFFYDFFFRSRCGFAVLPTTILSGATQQFKSLPNLPYTNNLLCCFRHFSEFFWLFLLRIVFVSVCLCFLRFSWFIWTH